MNQITKTIFVVFLMITTSAYAKGIISSLIGSSVGEVIGKSAAKSQSIDNRFLVNLANQTNKQLPMTGDKYTRIDNIIPGPGLRWTINNTIVTAESKNIDDSTRVEFLQAVQPQIKTKACSTPDMEFFFKNGVTVCYSYRTFDGGFIAAFDITPQDCGYPS